MASHEITVKRAPAKVVDGVVQHRRVPGARSRGGRLRPRRPRAESVSTESCRSAPVRSRWRRPRSTPRWSRAHSMACRLPSTARSTRARPDWRANDALVDEESGALTKAFAAFRGQLDELLGQTFDPDSKKSVLAVFERIFDEAADRQLLALRRVIDPDDADSPLPPPRRDRQDGQGRRGQADQGTPEVSEKIAVSKVQAELTEKTASKGFTFEELVHKTVSRIASAHADIAEHVGNTTGAAGSRSGDEVVTLCLDDTPAPAPLRPRVQGPQARAERHLRRARARDGQP